MCHIGCFRCAAEHSDVLGTPHAVIFTFLVMVLPVFGFTVMVTLQVPLPTIFTFVPETVHTFFEDDEVTVVLAPLGTVMPAAFTNVDDEVLLPTFDKTPPLTGEEVVDPLDVPDDELPELLLEDDEGGVVVVGETDAALVVTEIRADDFALLLLAITCTSTQ